MKILLALDKDRNLSVNRMVPTERKGTWQPGQR